MVFKTLCVIVLRTKVASALEGLKAIHLDVEIPMGFVMLFVSNLGSVVCRVNM